MLRLRLRIGRDPLRSLRPPNRLRGSAPPTQSVKTIQSSPAAVCPSKRLKSTFEAQTATGQGKGRPKTGWAFYRPVFVFGFDLRLGPMTRSKFSEPQLQDRAEIVFHGDTGWMYSI